MVRPLLVQEAGWHTLGKSFPMAGAISRFLRVSELQRFTRARLRFASVAWNLPKRAGMRTPRLPREDCEARSRDACHQQTGAVEKLTPAEDHAHHPNPVELRESARRRRHRASPSPRGLLGELPALEANINLLWGGSQPGSLSPRSERKQAAAVRFRLHDVGAMAGWLYDPRVFEATLRLHATGALASRSSTCPPSMKPLARS